MCSYRHDHRSQSFASNRMLRSLRSSREADDATGRHAPAVASPASHAAFPISDFEFRFERTGVWSVCGLGQLGFDARRRRRRRRDWAWARHWRVTSGDRDPLVGTDGRLLSARAGSWPPRIEEMAMGRLVRHTAVAGGAGHWHWPSCLAGLRGRGCGAPILRFPLPFPSD